MKVPVYDIQGKENGDIKLGKAFSRPLREDIIKRAFLAEISVKRQPYGTDPVAGQRSSARYKGRRKTRNSMMNREIARSKRIIAGGYMHFRSRIVPQAVKGRRAHPPKAWKIWEIKVNKKERLHALLSAISSTADRNLVLARGHKIGELKHVPLVLDDKVSELKKTGEVEQMLLALGLEKEIERCSLKKTRAGRGKTRGRRTIKRKGPLLVVAEDKGILKAARNIPGVDVSIASKLSLELLAPGSHPGRLTLWSKSAAEQVEKLVSG